MKRIARVLLPCLFVCSAPAQTSTPEAAPSTIRSTATEVMLDVVVRDKKGKPVKNLKKEDLQVFEDGTVQPISSFRFVGMKDAQEASRATSTPPLTMRPLHSTNVMCVVFHNLDPVSRRRAIEAADEFLKNDLEAETYYGVFILDDRLLAVSQITQNRAEALKVAQNAFSVRPMDFARASQMLLSASPLVYRVDVAVAAQSATINARVTGGEISKSVNASADVNIGSGANAMRGDQVSERTAFSNISGARELDKMNTLVEQLGTLPGRKTVLLLTTGFVTTGDPEPFQAMVDRASKAGITVYPLDVTGLAENSTSQAANVALGEVAGVSRTQSVAQRGGEVMGNSNLAEMKQKSLQGDNMKLAVRASDTQAALREMAEGTGGFLIANTNDYRKSFNRLVDDFDAHYEVIYHPTSTKYDGKLRKIDLKVAKGDWTAESRNGYFAMPDFKGSRTLAPHEMLALSALNADAQARSFQFQTAAFQFKKDAQESRNAIAIELPGTSLQAVPNPEKKTQMIHVSLLTLVKDGNGQVVDKYSADSPFEIPEANFAMVRTTPLTYRHAVDLPPGRYTADTVIIDRASGKYSTQTVSFENPAPRREVDMSSVVLVQRLEQTQLNDPADPLVFKGNNIVPFMSSQIPADAKPFAFFVVYPNKTNADKPKLKVEFLVDGKLLGEQTADLPDADASGAIPMVVRAVMHPGNCEFKISAIQGTESTTRSVKYTVAAK